MKKPEYIEFHDNLIDKNQIANVKYSDATYGSYSVEGHFIYFINSRQDAFAKISFESKDKADSALRELRSILNGDTKFDDTVKAKGLVEQAQNLLNEANSILSKIS